MPRDHLVANVPGVPSKYTQGGAIGRGRTRCWYERLGPRRILQYSSRCGWALSGREVTHWLSPDTCLWGASGGGRPGRCLWQILFHSIGCRCRKEKPWLGDSLACLSSLPRVLCFLSGQSPAADTTAWGGYFPFHIGTIFKLAPALTAACGRQAQGGPCPHLSGSLCTKCALELSEGLAGHPGQGYGGGEVGQK